MKNKSPLDRKIQLAFGSAILTLLVVGVISYHAMEVSSESDRWVRHTHEVLESLQDLLSSMQDLEASSRGFVLTGKESYLETYRASISRTEQEKTIVASLTADNPARRLQIPKLERLAAQKIQLAERVIDLRRTKGLEAAVDAIQNGEGQRIMEDYREVIREMEDDEQRLLVLRDAVAKRRLNQTRGVLILGTLLGLLVALAAVWSVQRDSSQRLFAEESLRESEERYRMLVDGVEVYAIFMMDPQGQILSWNAGAERIKGYSAEEIIGHNFSCFFPPEDIERGRPEEVLRMTAASGRREEQGMRVRKDGSRFLASVTFTALRDSAGNLRGFSEFSHDLSESEESGAKYRGLLEAAPDAMVVVNQAGEIVLLNVQAEKQFGYRRDELVGQKVKNIIPEGFAERLLADALRSAEDALAQQIGTGIELNGRRKNGSEFPIEIMLSPLESAEGILVTAAVRDITMRKKAEADLLQSQKMEAVGQLTGGIAHDFNNLLTVVIGNLGLLDRLVSDNEAAVKRVRTAQKGAARGADITRRLLVFSSNEELNPAFVSLGDAIQNMVEMASRGLGSDIKITTRLDHGVHPLFVDPAGLESALLNLVVNAKDAMPDGGSIVISSQLHI